MGNNDAGAGHGSLLDEGRCGTQRKVRAKSRIYIYTSREGNVS